MRVGLVTTSYPRFPGDLAGGFVAEHAAYLARVGCEVEVIAAGDSRLVTASGSGTGYESESGTGTGTFSDRGSGSGSGHLPEARGLRSEARGVRVRWVAASAGLFDGAGAPEELAGSARAWLAAARFSVALTREVARAARRWDAVIAHWLVPGGLAALVAAPRVPLLAIAHSGDVHLLRRLRALGAAGMLCRRADVRLSFVSEELRGIFLERAPRCAPIAQVCPMGVDVARLRAARAHRAGPGADSTVLFLGRLVPVKGVDVLIRAASLWRSNARLVIAGAGPAEPGLRRLAAAAPGRIHFAGQVLGADRDRALAAADLVALPSVRLEDGRSEGLPVVALEAMAAGAAVIASSVGGLADLSAVTHVAPGDPAALAAAVDALLLDPARRLRQVEAQDRLLPGLDWSAIGPRLMPPHPVRSRSLDRRCAP